MHGACTNYFLATHVLISMNYELYIAAFTHKSSELIRSGIEVGIASPEELYYIPIHSYDHNCRLVEIP